MDLFGKQYHEPGTMPGTLSESAPAKYSILLVDYDGQNYTEEENPTSEQCKAYIDSLSIHIRGMPSGDMLQQLSECFGLHSLHLEDILNVGQRPKLDIIDQQLFAMINLPSVKDNAVIVHQLGMFFFERMVISVCTDEENPFSLIYERLRKSTGKLRQRGADYLFYTLVDTAIDHGFPVLEGYAERIENLEDQLIHKPDASLLNDIHQLRRELLLLRRRLAPHREVINELLRDDEANAISESTRIYLRDCYDHTISILELLETYREMTAGMLEVYLSSQSHRLNEVMRVLTIIATVFIPPTFVVGVYGMNFDRSASSLNMPELSWPFGYLFVWALIIGMILGMLMYFKKQRWF